MSKLIVDEIQKNGGDALTLPTTDATVNNQPMLGSTSGVLSFGPTGLPAADGTNGQVLTANGSGASTWSALSVPPVPSDNILSVGMVISSSQRQNLYSTGEWSSSGPNGTYYNRLSDASSIGQAWNMLLGDGRPSNADYGSTGMNTMFYSGDSGQQYSRQTIYAHNKRLGHNFKNFYYTDNSGTSQNYAGVTWSAIPIRNSGASAATVTLKVTRSGGSNYGGTGIVYYTPTFSSGTNYANATGGAWTTCEASTSNGDYVNYTASITIPAATTIIVMMTSNHRYHTTARFKDTHMYLDLHSTFTGNIKCDLRMLGALGSARSPNAAFGTFTPYEMYTSCAALYGDR
tara:strand:+ start:4603 stop:5637 length:1035 start_codon:yes stop_codon:yes gene_type:complete